MNKMLSIFFALNGMLLAPTHLIAAELVDELQAYLSADVVAVGYVDLTEIDLAATINWVDDLGLISGDEKQELLAQAQGYQSSITGLTQLGVQRIFFLLRTKDLVDGGPTWIIPLSEQTDARAVQTLLMFGRPEQQASPESGSPVWLPGKWQTDSYKSLVGAYTERQLQAQLQAESTESESLADAWELLAQANCGIVVIGDQDTRRVVREMFPPLPLPFQEVTSSHLADGILWVGVAATLPPEISARIEIETTGSDIAKILQEAITTGWQLLEKTDGVTKFLDASTSQDLFAALAPQVAGSRVTIAPTEFTANAERLTKVLGPPIRALRQENYRHKRMNDFKNIALAVHNFADKTKTLPTQANYDAAGKPLLSWRVQILPYLGLNELYQEFHLREPWDSEHNRTLITKMPAIYADPDSALKKLNAAGKTTFVMPAGPKTLFDGSTEPKVFQDITDGTSNTIMLVEVAPENAVIWTKPADWEVDFFEPWKGLRRDERDWFTAAFWDAHAKIIDPSVDAKKLKALLTPAGDEVVEW